MWAMALGVPALRRAFQFLLKGRTMFAVYGKDANFNDPLASVVVGECPQPLVKEGWVRVKVTHASLNRHDVFTRHYVTYNSGGSTSISADQ
jgi:NADPH:quinone reductase-like Zn-dependent oxidoreductase